LTALKTVLNVLQDEGFLVDYGNVELGLLHATKSTSGTADQRYIGALGQIDNLTGNGFYGGIATIDATANVSDFGDQVKIRVNFQRKILRWNGGIATCDAITDLKTYQEFFAKVDRGLFIQRQGL
jgi:hypothetical protein